MMRLLIDCDSGLDDALAIALAQASQRFVIDGIVTVAGNADIETVTRNALAIAAALNSDIAIYRGSDRALGGEMRLGTSIWGGDGSLDLTGPRSAILPSAADAYRNARQGGEFTLVAIGPLTNVAEYLAQCPSEHGIERIVVMGGAFGRGNATPFAEFNFFADPHAAQRVLASNIPLALASLDLTRQMQLDSQDLSKLEACSNPYAVLFAKLMQLAGKPGHPAAIHDACTIAWLLWPELFSSERGTVSVNVEDTERLGESRFEPNAAGRHLVLSAPDRQALVDRIVGTICRSG